MSNVAIKENSGFVMRPYSFFQSQNGHKPSMIESMVKGYVFSMSSKEQCRIGYDALCKKFNVSKSSVARAVKKMKETSEFEVQRNGGKCSAYEYTGEKTTKNAHVRTENYFCTEKFNVYGVERCLTPAEVAVLSLVYTPSRNHKDFVGSIRKISRLLHIHKTTVEHAIKALFSAGLLTRKQKAANAHGESVFRVDLKPLRAIERKHKKEEKKAAKAAEPKLSQTVLDANARADFERHFARRRELAEKVANANVERANMIPGFKNIAIELSKMELSLAKAEMYEQDKLPALVQRQKVLQAQRAELLKANGLSAAMLLPQWKCASCSDTGYLPNGRCCACYTQRE